MTNLLHLLLLGLLGHSFAQASVNSQRSTLSSVFETTVKTVQSFVETRVTTLAHKETSDCIVEFEAGSFLSLADSILPETWTAKYIQPMAEHSGVALGKPTALCVESHTPVWVETNVDELRSSLIELRNTTPCSSALSMVVPNPFMSAVQEYMIVARSFWKSVIDWTSTTWSEIDSSAGDWITANSTAAASQSSSQPATNVLDDVSAIQSMTKSSLESEMAWTSAKWSEFDSESFVSWISAKSTAVGQSSSQPATNVLDDVRAILDMTKSSLENVIEWTSTKWSEIDSDIFDTTRAKSTAAARQSSSQPTMNVFGDASAMLDMVKSSLESAMAWTSAKWSEFDSEFFDWTRAKSVGGSSQSSSPPTADISDYFREILEMAKSSLESAMALTSSDRTAAKSTTASQSSSPIAASAFDDLGKILDMAKASLKSAMEWTSTKWSEIESESFDWTRAKPTAVGKSSSPATADMSDYFCEILDMTKLSLESAIEWTITKWSEFDSVSFDWTTAKSAAAGKTSSKLSSDYVSEILGMGKSSFEQAVEWTSSKWSTIASDSFEWTTAESAVDHWSSKSSQLAANVLGDFSEIMDMATSSLERAIDWANTKLSEIDSANRFDWATAKSTAVHCSTMTKSSLKSLTNWGKIQYSLVVQHWSPLEWSSNGAKAIVKYFVDWTKKQYALVKSRWSAIMADDRLSLDPKSVWESMWDGSGQLVKVPSWLRFLNTSNDPDLAWESFLQEANRQVHLARQERQRRRELILLGDPNRAKHADPEIM